MSEYDELVKRLRVAEVGEAFQTEDGSPELLPTELGLDAADAIEALVGEVERLKGVLEVSQKELKATQLVSLHLINELEEIASYDTAIECDEDGEEEQVEADVLIKRARSALEAKP